MNIPISVIIPTLNEEQAVSQTLAVVKNSNSCEMIVVDGGSSDATVPLARESGARIIESPRGRGRQMNTGAAAASGTILLFLHADTLLPANFPELIYDALHRPGVAAGAFSLAIASTKTSLTAVAFFANLRSRLLQLPYGDQALFTNARMFAAIGGFPEMAIMEDYVFIQRLKKHGRIAILPEKAVTSARRWENMGPLRTTLINQIIVGGHTVGIPPVTLAKWYQRLRGLGKPPRC